MAGLCVYTLFNGEREPIAVGILDTKSQIKKIYTLYAKGSGVTLYEIEQNSASITKILTAAIANSVPVYTCDFKTMLSAFAIPLVRGVDYNVYDVNWSTVASINNANAARAVVSKMLDRLANAKVSIWHRVFANAAVVYQDLENRGINTDVMWRKPIWSQDTFSGRSKNLSVNIQGVDGDMHLVNPVAGPRDVFVYFDWIAADLRIASLLSGDEVLEETFVKSDPYTALVAMLSSETGSISRSDCKRSLLQSINSFNYDHPVLNNIFVKLGAWLQHARKMLDTDGYLTSILGRKFALERARDNNPRAVLNGILQGSVAHAMQRCIKLIWDKFGLQLLVEIHDSNCLTTSRETILTTVDDVTRIMGNPFSGLLDTNPFFPVKVSIGTKFRQWMPFRVYRQSGMEDISGQETPREESTGTSEVFEASDGDGYPIQAEIQSGPGASQ